MQYLITKKNLITVIFALLILINGAFAQAREFPASQEISEEENVPVLLKHLPSWESKKETAKYFVAEPEFKQFLRDRKIIENVEFFPSTEAVFANYPEGGLLIVEYATPQVSVAVDKAVSAVSGDGSYVYRRIGNYNVFLFDPTDKVAANNLLGKIKFEKIVTWPYGEPKTFFEKEREFIVGTTSLFVSTALFVVAGVCGAIVVGAICGVIYYHFGYRRRASMNAFSDAGGLTRLNLDGLSADEW